MKTIDLKWEDLVTLANEGKVVIDEITLIVGRPMLPEVNIDVAGIGADYVKFYVDNTDDAKR